MRGLPGGAAGQGSSSYARASVLRVALFLTSLLALAFTNHLNARGQDKTQDAAPAIVDTDGDGMPDDWETFFGLNPNDPTDAALDPDGDGLTNLQEYQQGGHPFGVDKHYFAEGAQGFFQTDIGLVNPSTTKTAKVQLTYVTETGTRYYQRIAMPPMTRQTVSANANVPGNVGGISTIVESDTLVAADRYMQWGANGYGSSLASGVPAPATQWYFAEGATGPFSLYYLLLNPGSTIANVSIKYLPEGGAPITRTYTVPAHTRKTIGVNDDRPLAFGSMGAAVTSDVPIVAERSMYLSTLFELFTAGSAGPGATALSTQWTFAEGAGGFFDEFILLANPNPTPATATVVFRRPDGVSATATYAIAAQSRTSVWVNHEADTNPALAPIVGNATSAVITATQPIVAERTMWWPSHSLFGWYENSTTLGSPVSGLSWIVAEGSAGGTQHEQTYVLVTNTGTTAGQVQFTVLSDNGHTATQTLPINASGRITLDIGLTFGLSNTHFSVFVDSVGPSPVPLVTEYSRYGSGPGDFRVWSAGDTTRATLKTNVPPPDTAPTVTSTTPANNATNVPFDSNLTVTFSEPVNVTATAFTLECPVGTPITLNNTTTSPATTFTLHPTPQMPLSTACKFVIHGAGVTDSDTVDPPDAMTSDVTVNFTTGGCPLITVSPSTLTGASVGVAYGPVQFTQTGGHGTITWSKQSGTLPPGITFSAAGALSGTPTTPGNYTFTIRATDANGCFGEVTVTLNVTCPTIIIAPSTLTDSLVGAPYTPVQFTQTGSPTAVTWTLQSGALPAGMTLTSGGMLSGTPTATGTFTFTARATDTNGCFGEQTFTIHITCPTIVVNPATLTDGTVGVGYGPVNFSQTGSTGTPTFSVSAGTLPTGLSLTTGGVLSGTVTVAGPSSFTVSATDQFGCSGSRALTVTFNCPTITVTPGTLSDANVGVAYGPVQFTQTGAPTAVTWTLQSGTLPTGMTLSAAGLLSGTPTATGTFTITVRATDTNGCFGQVTVTFHIICPTITVNPATLSNGTVGTPYGPVSLTTTGSTGTPTFSVTTGTLPTGLTLTTGGNLSGTVTAAGTSSFTVTATDQYGCSGARGYSVQFNCPTITVTPTSLTQATVGNSYGPVSFSQTGGVGTATFSIVAGTLPTGMTLSGAGVLSGTPTTTGSFTITVRATDSNGCFGEVTVTLGVVCPTVTITNPATTLAVGGVPFTVQFTEVGVGSPTWSIVSGTLPTGLSFNTSNAVLSGTPVQTGSFPIQVQVSAGFGCTTTGSPYPLVVNVNAINDTFTETVLGNVGIDSSLLPFSATNNDIASTKIIAGFSATSAQGGTVSMVTSGAGVGQFTYDPPRGYQGSDTFTYVLSDGVTTATGTVTLNVGTPVWFINNNAGACPGAPCDGRLSHPYTSLATFQAANNGSGVNPRSNNTIFLAESGTHYTGPVALLAGQKLYGQDSTAASFGALTGLTVPLSSGTAGLPVPNAVNATFTQIDGGGAAAIVLNSGNTVRGLTVNTSIGGGITGGSVGSFTASEASVTGTGPAVTLSNGALNATFKTLSSSAGVTGLSLTNTTGSLTVTGDGSTLGSGGTLSGGSPNVSLNTAAGVSLNFMTITGAGTDGIFGNGVNGLTLNHVVVQNSGAAAAGNMGVDISNLTGTVNITNSTFTGSADDNFFAEVSGGSMGMTVTNSTFSNNSPSVSGANDGLLLQLDNNSSSVISITGSTFSANKGDHFQMALANSASADLTFTGNTLTGGNTGALAADILINAATGVPGYSGTVTYNISNNNISGSILSAINVILGTSSATGFFSGVILNNTIGNAAVALSGSAQAAGIDVEARGNGMHNVRVQGNTIQRVFDRGIQVVVGDGNSGVLNMNVWGNTVSNIEGSFGRQAFEMDGGVTSTNVFGGVDAPTICLSLGGAGALANTLTHQPSTTDDFRIRQRFNSTINLPGYAGASGDTAAVVSFVSVNNHSAAGSAAVSGTGGGFVGGASCSTP